MTVSAICLAAAGAIGILTAVIHGVIMQRHMIGPLVAHLDAEPVLSRSARALVAPLLQVSTLAWAVAGIALVYSAVSGKRDAQHVAAAIAFILYLHATIANAAAVRSVHPGWLLMGLATILIVVAQF